MQNLRYWSGLTMSHNPDTRKMAQHIFADKMQKLKRQIAEQGITSEKTLFTEQPIKVNYWLKLKKELAGIIP